MSWEGFKLDWIEVTVVTTAEVSEAVANLLIEEGAQGVVEASAAERTAYFPLDTDWKARLDRIERSVAGLSCFGLDVGPAKVTFRTVSDEDWAEAWKAHFHPLRLGRRIVVRPSWREFRARREDLVIDLDPGMAFGTGNHPTTALCVESLEEAVAPGSVVFDVGTGSGILAIAACLLGAARVWACDIDPVAVRVARENAARNGAADRVGVLEGSWPVLFPLPEKADVVVANILAPVILSMAEDARRLVRPGGAFIAAGITREQGDEVAAGLCAAGWNLERRLEREAWVSFVARSGDGGR